MQCDLTGEGQRRADTPAGSAAAATYGLGVTDMKALSILLHDGRKVVVTVDLAGLAARENVCLSIGARDSPAHDLRRRP